MRLCKIRLRGRHYNTTLIFAPAPTDDKDETEKDLLYDLFMKSYNSCPAQDMKLVIGDFNAEIGRELFISSNAGLQSLHKETNENGQRLWDFAVSENLFIISTAFPRKEIHKYTWISPVSQTHNQIDHVLIGRRHRNNIMDVRSYRGSNVHTDHILVRSKVRFRLCKNFFRKRENGNYKPDTSKLMEKNIIKEYKLKLSAGIIPELDSSGNDFNWKSVKEIILKSENETAPGLERRARNEWYDEDCRKVTEMKNKVYLQLLQKH
ncbi:craniofacial development protein 2 [Trichonephila clavipes]|nr:craniofacial development protein 2 [Trichonephila clavipes]